VMFNHLSHFVWHDHTLCGYRTGSDLQHGAHASAGSTSVALT
jgi:hypothetical protein